MERERESERERERERLRPNDQAFKCFSGSGAWMVCNKCVDIKFWPSNVPRGPVGSACSCVKTPIVFSSTTFEKSTVIDAFCNCLFFTPSVTKGYTAIAHNGSRYDSHFILSWLLEKNMVVV